MGETLAVCLTGNGLIASTYKHLFTELKDIELEEEVWEK